jgi:hypothetical protein
MQTLRLVALILAALGLAPGAAHVLELPVKMTYTPELYAAVTSTLYAWFGSVGAAVQVGALLSAGWLGTGRAGPRRSGSGCSVRWRWQRRSSSGARPLHR